MVMQRLVRFSIVKAKRLFLPKDLNNIAKWRSIKNKYEGKRVFILGNGPSLNKTPLYLLKDEYKLCFNHFNLMFDRIGWFPDFYMVTDDMVIRDAAEQLNQNILPKVKYGFFPDLHPNNTDFKKYVNEKENVLWLKTDNPKFSKDLPNCGINNTVVNAGLQAMAYLGFKEIYLLGVDASYSFESHKVKNINTRDLISQEEDPNHFDPRYFGKGKRYHYQPMYEMVKKFEVAKVFLENLGIKVVNAGVNGNLEVFDRKPLEKVLDYKEEEKERLFLQAIPNVSTDTFDDFVKDAVNITDIDKFTPDLEKVITTVDTGIKLIQKSIFSHIPFGPFRDKYIFIKR